mgnify:CR=1 FL=1
MRKNKAVFDISYLSNRKGFIYALARRESSADLNQDDLANRKSLRIKNDKGYIGLFQYGTDALIDIGYKTEEGVWTGKNGAVSQEAFRSSREIQIAAINLSIDLWCKRLRVWGFNEYYGKIVKGIEITESGCIAGCHLVGSGGLASFLDMPGNHKINRKTGKRHREFDGNQTHISEYIKLFANYDLETCCKRKIRVKLQDVDGLPLKDKTVKILSSYDGKHLNSKFEVTHKTDTDGELPVIVRHPGAEIILEIDGRESETISQKADQVQPYTITASDMKVSAPLAAKGTPEPKKQDEITQQTQNPASESEDAASKDVNFHLTILEGDTKKPISNVKFTLVYKGTPKQHITNTEGIKENLRAEIGQTIQVCIAGEGKLQPITSFTVTESLRDTVVKVSLPVHTFTIIVVDTKGKAVSNTEFSIFYRQREKSKKTDHEGRLKVKALVGFVYGFGNKGKPLLHLRCLQSVSIRQITVNQTAIQNAQGALGTNSITAVAEMVKQAASSAVGQVLKPKNNTTQNKQHKQPSKQADKQASKQPEKPRQSEPIKQMNTHTEKNGNPLTIVGEERKSEADKTQRKGLLPSGVEWVKKFPNDNSIEALRDPFKSNLKAFLAALKEAGVSVHINAVYRPPQRSYLMYYANFIAAGGNPNTVPSFKSYKEAKNAEDVNIDWTCGGNIRLARANAQKMKNAYGIGGNPVGKPYRSNHNKRQAIDMKLFPQWGIGKTVKNASGQLVVIKSKRDIIEVGKTYKVFHWDITPKKRRDNPHWSATGN